MPSTNDTRCSHTERVDRLEAKMRGDGHTCRFWRIASHRESVVALYVDGQQQKCWQNFRNCHGQLIVYSWLQLLRGFNTRASLAKMDPTIIVFNPRPLLKAYFIRSICLQNRSSVGNMFRDTNVAAHKSLVTWYFFFKSRALSFQTRKIKTTAPFLEIIYWDISQWAVQRHWITWIM